ncbi:MAG: hypothetical protein AAB364_02905 [Patescibacteria group bacterium]
METISQELSKNWHKLPKMLQDFILDGDWEDNLDTICKRHQLSEEQSYALKVETSLVLFGLEAPTDFAANVQGTLPNIETSGVIANVQEEIFKNVKEQLTELNSKLDQEDQMVNERIKKLPPELQQAISSNDSERIVQEIGKKYGLHIDQVGELDNEVWQVMLGVKTSANFVVSIMERLKVDGQTAENIAREANEKIFLKIRESLKQMEENKNTPKPEELLHELEQHTSPASLAEKPSIFERKLSEPVNLKPETPAPTPPTPAPEIPIKKVDPYHEPIE